MDSKEHDTTHLWLQEQLAARIDPLDVKDELYEKLLKVMTLEFNQSLSEQICRDWFDKNYIFYANDAGASDFSVDSPLGRLRSSWFKALDEANMKKSTDRE